MTIEPGSFFEHVPSGGDAYMLSHIIHDWSEEQGLTILGNCRRAMKPDSRLLLNEMVLPPGNAPHPGKVLDMMMLVGPGGQERTEQEYAALFSKADYFVFGFSKLDVRFGLKTLDEARLPLKKSVKPGVRCSRR